MAEVTTMALLRCPDCGKDVSSTAKSCLHCGRSMRYWTAGRIVLAIFLGLIVLNISTCFTMSFFSR